MMTYEEAIDRLPNREVPDWWVGSNTALDAVLEDVDRGDRWELTRTPGGQSIEVVAYGDSAPPAHLANYNSAIGAGQPQRFVDRDDRERGVVLFVGPVHGDEVEGLTGLANLIQVLETGRDLRGQKHPRLAGLAADCRLLIIPIGNPDGLARFEPAALQGCTEDDLRFWGQGTWADETFMGWPNAKRLHPMVPEEVEFLGGYFNDDGINPMHDEFMSPMGPEAPAILDLARSEAPDVILSLHSHPHPPAVLRPTYLPMSAQQEAQTIAEGYCSRLSADALPAGPVFDPQPETGDPPPTFNLVSALHHVCGATSFTHESPHGLQDGCPCSFTDLLSIQLALYETVLEHVT